jgi:Luciferase-like monooxygenase
MDRLGYDGVGIDEHHATPHGLMNSPNITAAAGAQRTKRLKFFILGNLLPLHNPLRIAEELAMVDCLSGGRTSGAVARYASDAVSLDSPKSPLVAEPGPVCLETNTAVLHIKGANQRPEPSGRLRAA